MGARGRKPLHLLVTTSTLLVKSAFDGTPKGANERESVLTIVIWLKSVRENDIIHSFEAVTKSVL